MRSLSFRRCCVLLLLMVVGGEAAAICLPIPYYRYVGAGCTYASIQAAIDTGELCPGTTIVVTNTQPGNPVVYTNQAITIQSKTLTIAGSRSACNTPPPVCNPGSGCGGSLPAQIAIVGNGVDPVFKIRGNSSVNFAHVDISGGKGSEFGNEPGGGISHVAQGGTLGLRNVSVHHNSASGGGGIGFYGSGTLRLDGAFVHHNTASNNGGGVYAAGFGGHVDFQIVDNAAQHTQFTANEALMGGGVAVAGDVRVDAASTQLTFDANRATGAGGALYVAASAKVDIAATMTGNGAGNGGAIAVVGDSATRVRLYGIDAVNHSRLDGNSASNSGGALSVSTAVTDGNPLVCVFDTAMRGNTAGPGDNFSGFSASAVAVSAGRVRINPDDGDADCGYATLAKARHCAPGAATCNRVQNNIATGASGLDDDAAVFAVLGGTLLARRLQIDANNGGFVVVGGGASAQVTFEHCLVHHNTATHEVLRGYGATFGIDSCTFADDVNVNAAVFNSEGPLLIERSIVRESKRVFAAGGATTARYAIFNAPAIAGTDGTVFYLDPAFADAANGDYRLAGALSYAVDFAPADPLTGGGDLDRQPRVVDEGSTSDIWGKRDLGPYEYQVGGVRDRIFLGRFE